MYLWYVRLSKLGEAQWQIGGSGTVFLPPHISLSKLPNLPSLTLPILYSLLILCSFPLAQYTLLCRLCISRG